MKDYGKALEAYDQGLKLDENNTEITEAINRTLKAMNTQDSSMSDQERLQNVSIYKKNQENSQKILEK